MYPTKQLVKQLEEPQPKPQVEQEKTPQEQIKINHEDGGDLMKKKKIRRGGRARHPMLSPLRLRRSDDDSPLLSRLRPPLFFSPSGGLLSHRWPALAYGMAMYTPLLDLASLL